MKAILSVVSVLVLSAAECAAWCPKERWRGFNLPGKAIKGSFSGDWSEDDLRMMHEFGFNFARIPIDYRYWCCYDDWTKPDPDKFPAIDEIIAWGRKYGIHIQICFSTPPGMELKPRSKKPLFNNPAVQDTIAANWAYFARRYRDIPNDELSFNLFNEPDGSATEENYLPLVKKLVAAIHAEDPKRFIVIDGLKLGRKPLLGAIGLPVGQSHHAYNPMNISHYRATWLKGSFASAPSWPPSPATSPLFGSRKPESTRVPVVINDVPKGKLTLKTGLFNREVELIVEADGKTLFSHFYRPLPHEPGWTNIVARDGGKEWAAELVEPICIDVPECRRLSVRMGRGDWLNMSSIELSANGKTAVLPFSYEWDIIGRHDLRFAGFGAENPFLLADGSAYTADTYLDDKTLHFWKPVLDAGQFVMVGETGAFNKTPHDISLRWLEDNLRRWKAKGIGWAMWNFRGSMGIMDSARADVEYEDYKGHKLDRKMLELLQRY